MIGRIELEFNYIADFSKCNIGLVGEAALLIVSVAIYHTADYTNLRDCYGMCDGTR